MFQNITFVMSFRTPLWAKVGGCVNINPKRPIMPTSPHSSQPPAPPAISRAETAEGSETATLVAVFHADLEGRFTGCNSAFSRLVAYPIGELIGRDFSALFAAGNTSRKDKEKDQLRKTILSTTSAEGDYRAHLLAQPKSGSSFAVDFALTLICDAASKPMAMVAVVMPVRQGKA